MCTLVQNSATAKMLFRDGRARYSIFYGNDIHNNNSIVKCRLVVVIMKNYKKKICDGTAVAVVCSVQHQVSLQLIGDSE